MQLREPRFSQEQFARYGQAIYEKRLRQQVEQSNSGRIMAIDVETDELEMGTTCLLPSAQLLARRPGAQLWFVRSGTGRHTGSANRMPVVRYD